jgi:isopropylmalate/homocitrate/citramalate synthase
MTDLPSRVDITEEGPREGFQIEPGPIPTADKIALIDALSATGAKRIQVAYKAYSIYRDWKRDRAATLLGNFWRKIRRIDAVRKRFLQCLAVVRGARVKQLAVALLRRTMDGALMRVSVDRLRLIALPLM